MSIANCLILVRGFFLCILRYKHPAVKHYLRNLLKKTRNTDDIDPLEELNSKELEYNWLGSLLESIRASQVLSFLTGMLVSYVEYYPKQVDRLKSVDYRSSYTFCIG
jgi:hypothetical protein